MISTTGEYPLKMGEKHNIFKVLMLDIGLFQNLAGIKKDLILSPNLMPVYKGAFDRAICWARIESALRKQ